MPSSYTSNNGLEKPATGEQSGTWGGTVNDNSNLIDQSLDGQISITLAAAGDSGSPNDLPITDGTVSNGRNRFIEFTDGGDLGADAYVQLTPSTAEKLIYIRNSLSGSRSLYLFQGTYSASRDYILANGGTALLKFSGEGASSSTVTIISDTADSSNVTVVNTGAIRWYNNAGNDYISMTAGVNDDWTLTINSTTEISLDSSASSIDFQNNALVTTGNLSVAGITATANLSVVGITASGNIGGVDITASGNMGAVDVAASGDITGASLDVTGDVEGDSLFLNEKAAADADQAGKAQVWAKNTTPCELWFTDDAGTDVQLGTTSTTPDPLTLDTFKSNGEIKHLLGTSTSIDVSAATRHRVANNGGVTLTFSGVPSGDDSDLGADYQVEGMVVIANAASPGTITVSGLGTPAEIGSPDETTGNVSQVLTYLIQRDSGTNYITLMWSNG